VTVVKIAFLTGASCAGKTWTSRRLEAEYGLPILDVDAEVFAPIFTSYRRPELRNSINPTSSWAFLRKQTDFDGLFRRHHRDWFTRMGGPAAFVAVGWIYCFAEWRNQVVAAFREMSNREGHFKLFVLQPTYDDFFTRFSAAVEERFGAVASFFKKSPSEQRKEADDHYRQFRERDVQLPRRGEMEYEVCLTAEDLVPRVARYCFGDRSSSVPETDPPISGTRP
jgi:hypothetical protein